VPGESALRKDDDRELLDLVRAGDPDAYGELYARHSAAAHRFARSLVDNRTDADDAVAEVFASLLATLQRGRGPTDLFLPYVLTSIRNECQRINRRGSRETVARFDRLGSVVDARRHHADPVSELAEAEVISTALTALPDNLREILWRTEVREEPAREIAAERGATPHAVAESALRARRALGSAYLQLHAAGGTGVDDLEEGCRDTRPYLAAYIRRSLGSRRSRHIERHLLACQDCADAHEDLGRVNRRLRIAPILPVDVGVASMGVKAQIAAWFAASAAPIAASGAVVVTVLGPVTHVPDRPSTSNVVVDDGTAVLAPTSPEATTITVGPADAADAPSSRAAGEPAGLARTTSPWAVFRLRPSDAVPPVAPVPASAPGAVVADEPGASASPAPAATDASAPRPTPAASPVAADPPGADQPVAPPGADQPAAPPAGEQPAEPSAGPLIAPPDDPPTTTPPAADGGAGGSAGGQGSAGAHGPSVPGNGRVTPPAPGLAPGGPGAPASPPSPTLPEQSAATGSGPDRPRPAAAATAPGVPGNPVANANANAGVGRAGAPAADRAAAPVVEPAPTG